MPAASILQDLRYGARVLRRAPIFTAVAVLSVAGALAAGTGVFAFMNAVMYRPLGVGDGDNLYRIYTSNSRGTNRYNSSSYADYESFREAKDIIASACATERVRATLQVGATAQMHEGEVVSPGCFTTLKLAPQRGRFFQDEPIRPGDPVPIVISNSLWTRRFASDPSVIGRTMLLNGMNVAVTAIAPVGFVGTSFDGGADFWAPIDVAPAVFPTDVRTNRGMKMFTIFARLADGVDRQRAEAGLAVVAARLRQLDERAWSDTTGATRKVTVMRETEARFVDSPGGGIGIVVGAIAAVLIIIAIACVNLATMLLARGAARAREMSIRLAIGASHRRVLRQLATESLMIAAAGAAIAMAVVWAGVRLFNAYRPVIIPAFDVALDWRVFTFGIVIAVVAALTFGLLPAAHTLRLALAEGLKGRVVAARGAWLRLGAREALIVTQVAVSVALLLVSTLFVRAMSARATVPTGFDGTGVTVMTAHLEAVPEKDRDAVVANTLRTAQSVPGVDRVALAVVIPLSGSNTGYELRVGDQQRVFLANIVSPGYFSMLQIPLRAGRDFSEADRRGAGPVAIVNESFARAMWGTTNAVGRTLGGDSTRLEVVGVVGDTRYRALTEPFQPILYRPIAQEPVWRFIIHARTRGEGPTLAALDGAVRAVDRRMALQSAMSLRAYMEQAMAPERATKWLGAAVGVMQLLLAVMALWGLVAYAVERRTTELGVRLALGATPDSLVRLMMRPAATSIAIGVGVGCVLGAVIAKVVQSQSVGLAPLSLLMTLPVAALFTLVAMSSAWWPARRAGLADPAASLRRE